MRSVLRQLEPEDRLIVLRDGRGDWGYSARNEAVEQARTTHLVFIDDDDVFTDGAFAAFRGFAREHPGRIGIFRMRHEFWERTGYGRLIWEEPAVRKKNVGTPMLLVPNVPERLGRFDPLTYSGDYSFVEETVKLMGEPVFVDSVVARIRPDRRPKPLIALDRALRLTPRVQPVRTRLKPRTMLRRALRKLGLTQAPSDER